LLQETRSTAFPLLAAKYAQMNFTQIHERLRQELLRRIQRGTVSVSLLARQTGFGQSHLSNFLHRRRHLSLDALDRILDAQHLTLDDLLPESPLEPFGALPTSDVPVVRRDTALFEPHVRRASVDFLVQIPQGALTALKVRTPAARRAWQRFVGFQASDLDVQAMDPLLLPSALVVIDRHALSLRSPAAGKQSLFAVLNGAHVVLRYAEFRNGRIVLRPRSTAFPVELIEVDSEVALSTLVAGRVAFILNAA
jgi:hypothetical protein